MSFYEAKKLVIFTMRIGGVVIVFIGIIVLRSLFTNIKL